MVCTRTLARKFAIWTAGEGLLIARQPLAFAAPPHERHPAHDSTESRASARRGRLLSGKSRQVRAYRWNAKATPPHTSRKAEHGAARTAPTSQCACIAPKAGARHRNVHMTCRPAGIPVKAERLRPAPPGPARPVSGGGQKARDSLWRGACTIFSQRVKGGIGARAHDRHRSRQAGTLAGFLLWG